MRQYLAIPVLSFFLIVGFSPAANADCLSETVANIKGRWTELFQENCSGGETTGVCKDDWKRLMVENARYCCQREAGNAEKCSQKELAEAEQFWSK